MARLQVFVGADMSTDAIVGDGGTLSPFDVVLTEASNSRIAVRFGDFDEAYLGTFYYDVFGDITGQVRGYEYKYRGDFVTRITNLDVDAYSAIYEVDPGEPQDLYDLFFTGADTFIGSNFADHLISFSGNDTLFGGAGADTLEGGDGRDRVQGQNGNDALYGGRGDDYVSGGAGADLLVGEDGADNLLGEAGPDYLSGGRGNDVINGGDGTDTANYNGTKSNYLVELTTNGSRIVDKGFASDGTDQLIDIEILNFADGAWTIDAFDDVASLSEAQLREFIEVYIAYFNRAPDAEGLFFYGTAFANGTSLETSAATFLNSVEYRATYPASQSNQQFAEAVYNNVLGRIPDAAGLEFWVNVLDSGARSRDVFILEVLKGAKAPAGAGAPQDYVDQKAADVAYLSNKTDVGLYFSVIKGMSNVANAKTAMQLFDDGHQTDINAAKSAIDSFYADALDGEFLLQLVGVIDDPFVA